MCFGNRMQKTYVSARRKQGEKQWVRWGGGVAAKFGPNKHLAHIFYNVTDLSHRRDLGHT